ncbi:MAG: hypothetical protein GY820_47010 [Gammaproteobacteria bacterium]|nr:hypothetical protein [Gammaproteobacteria bacterium]
MNIINQFVIVAILSISSFSSNSQELQNNHIQLNLPDTFEEFNVLLSRELTAYFSELENKPITVEYELLRKQPTQSGVSYPKFYAWVVVKSNTSILNVGAVRVLSINKVKIKVSNFITTQEIRLNPKKLKAIFPASLYNIIRQKSEL